MTKTHDGDFFFGEPEVPKKDLDRILELVDFSKGPGFSSPPAPPGFGEAEPGWGWCFSDNLVRAPKTCLLSSLDQLV